MFALAMGGPARRADRWGSGRRQCGRRQRRHHKPAAAGARRGRASRV